MIYVSVFSNGNSFLLAFNQINVFIENIFRKFKTSYKPTL